jgi:hypothetical protein
MLSWQTLPSLLLAGATLIAALPGGSARAGEPASAATSTVFEAPPSPTRLCPPSGIPVPCSLEQLARLSWPELEQLYRQAAPPAVVPHGYLRGRAIYCRDKALSGARSAATRVLWHGKHFEDGCTMVNQWCGLKTIRARIYPGPSWLDGNPALVLDYCGTSRVWADVRDEIREVAPGLYLGAMYRRRIPCPAFQMFFALEAPSCHK